MKSFVNTRLFSADGNLNASSLHLDNTSDNLSSRFGVTPKKSYDFCRRNIVSILSTSPAKKSVALKPSRIIRSKTLSDIEKDFIKRYLRINHKLKQIKSELDCSLISSIFLDKFLSQDPNDPNSHLAKFLSDNDVINHFNSMFMTFRGQDLKSSIGFLLDFSKDVSQQFASDLDLDNPLKLSQFYRLRQNYNIDLLMKHKTSNDYFIEQLDNNALSLSHFNSLNKIVQSIRAYPLFSAREDYPGFLLDLESGDIPTQALSLFINNLFMSIPEGKENKVVFYFRANSDKLSTDLLNALINFPGLNNCFLELYTNTSERKKSVFNILKTNFSFEEFYDISLQKYSPRKSDNWFSVYMFQNFVVSLLDLDKLFSLKPVDNAKYRKNLIKEIFSMSYSLYFQNGNYDKESKSLVNEFIRQTSLKFDDDDQLYSIKLLYLMLKFPASSHAFKLNEFTFMIHSLVTDDRFNSKEGNILIKEKLVNKIFDIYLRGSMSFDELYEIQSLKEELDRTYT